MYQILFIRNFEYLENCNIYIDLMKKFIDKKISGIKFSDQFFQKWKLDRDKTYNSKELVHMTGNFKLIEIDGVSSLIPDLFLDCEFFGADSSLREDYKIFEEKLRNCVGEILLEIKDLYP